MTDVEIAVSFFALLGGLLLANVANNIADALRARRDLHFRERRQRPVSAATIP